MINLYSGSATMARLLRNRVFIVTTLVLLTLLLTAAFALGGTRLIEIREGGRIHTLLTRATDPDQIVEQAALTVYPGDQITLCQLSDHSGSLIIDRAQDITVTCGLHQQTVRLTADHTVADAVKAAGFTPDGDDVCTPAMTESLQNVYAVTVDEVSYATYTVTETMPYQTIETETDELTRGETKVTEEGQEGVLIHTHREKTVNGEVVEDTLIATEITASVIDRTVLVGTAEPKPQPTVKTDSQTGSSAGQSSGDAVQTAAQPTGTISNLTPSTPIEMDETGRPVHYKELITGKATAYTARDGSLTATGRSVAVGYVAVNPKQIPYGSELYIRTPDGRYIYGYAIAADTGGFAKQGRITVDLFFNTESECYQFGVRNVEIYVLN